MTSSWSDNDYFGALCSSLFPPCPDSFRYRVRRFLVIFDVDKLRVILFSLKLFRESPFDQFPRLVNNSCPTYPVLTHFHAPLKLETPFSFFSNIVIAQHPGIPPRPFLSFRIAQRLTDSSSLTEVNQQFLLKTSALGNPSITDLPPNPSRRSDRRESVLNRESPSSLSANCLFISALHNVSCALHNTLDSTYFFPYKSRGPVHLV